MNDTEDRNMLSLGINIRKIDDSRVGVSLDETASDQDILDLLHVRVYNTSERSDINNKDILHRRFPRLRQAKKEAFRLKVSLLPPQQVLLQVA